MALRLVRETSDTPNITNKDDVIMARYAYGGYNGVVKAFGSECGYTAENGVFTINSGRIVIDGWEIDIDAVGWSIDLSNVAGMQCHSIYTEINAVTENVKIVSTYLPAIYPEIDKGDDLTQRQDGTARLLLYHVKVDNGKIIEVVKGLKIIPYHVDLTKTSLAVSGLLNNIYPIGSIYMSVNNTSPEKLFGGEWQPLQERFLLGAGSNYPAGSVGGEATHTLTIDEMPSHFHGSQQHTSRTGVYNYVPINPQFAEIGYVNTTTEGGSQPHNIMPPYLSVYMWKRTA